MDIRNPRVDVAHDLGPIERRADERVHLPGRVDVAHPEVAVGPDPELLEGVDEQAGEMPGVACVAVAGRVRDMGERAAHLAFDRVGRQQRLGVHRIHVVDAVEVRRLDAIRAQGARDRVDDHGAAQAADVDRPRGRLRIVDDLRPADARGKFVGPVHELRLAGGQHDAPAGASPRRC